VKIIEDKVTVDPPHALSKADARVILNAVPETWKQGITAVRLSGALQQSQNTNQNRFSETFTIISRGSTKEQSLRRVLTDLAARGLGVQFLLWHRLQQRDASRLRRVVTPLMDKLLPRLSREPERNPKTQPNPSVQRTRDSRQFGARTSVVPRR
jgi:hypothetical protein